MTDKYDWPDTEFQLRARFVVPEHEWETFEPGWIIELPHQCDTWTIAGDPARPVSDDEAAEALRIFIAEAKEVLKTLTGKTE